MDRPSYFLTVLIMVIASARTSGRGESQTTNIVSGIYTNVGGTLTVGNTGSSNALFVINEGWLENSAGIIGYNFDANDNTAFISGSNSRWDNGSMLYLGYAGSGNRALVSAGGRLSAPAGTVLGYDAGSSNNSLVVSGTGSTWVSGPILVGYAGSGNSVVITNGGVANSNAGDNGIGFSPSSSRNSLLISGVGAQWFVRNLSVGAYEAHHNQLTISAGARVIAYTGYLGSGRSNTVSVAGADSLWDCPGGFFLGNDGMDNQLIVTNGGLLNCVGTYITGSNNTAVISGTNSLWETGQPDAQLAFLDFSIRNQIFITNGGRLNSRAGIILGDSNTIQLSGSGSLWDNRELLQIGQDFYSGNQVTVTNGARINSMATTLAGDDGLLALNGTNSLLSNTGVLSVGDEGGMRNKVTLSSGARINTASSYIGGTDNSYVTSINTDNAALVTGAGSVWNNTNDFFIGVTGARSSLVIADGGQVSNRIGHISYYGDSPFNVVTINGTNSLWHNLQDLYVGYAGSYNQLVITNGGRANSLRGFVGRQYNRNNSALITGAGSLWNVSSDLTIGNTGTENRMTVANAGKVSDVNGFIDAPAFSNPGKSNAVLVTGTGSLWSNSGALSIGVNSPFNQLTIETGGTVQANSLALGNTSVSFGNAVTLPGGNLIVTNSAGSGLLQIARANLTVNGGSVSADRISATAGSQSVVTLNGGARLALLKGPHALASGLNVPATASLSAAGTFGGSITNGGRLDVGAAVGTLAINGNLSLADSSQIDFKLGGINPISQYDFIQVASLIQFGGALRVALTNNFMPARQTVFTLMQFGSSGGAFSNVSSGMRLNVANNSGSFRVDYDGASLRLSDFQSTNSQSLEVDEAWASQYFGHYPLTEEEKRADADSDGMSNYGEYIAGTNPTNAASVLKVTSTVRNGLGQTVVQFQCVTNKVYGISYSTNQLHWAEVYAPAFTRPSPGTCQWIDDGTLTGGSAPIRYYQVSVR